MNFALMILAVVSVTLCPFTYIDAPSFRLGCTRSTTWELTGKQVDDSQGWVMEKIADSSGHEIYFAPLSYSGVPSFLGEAPLQTAIIRVRNVGKEPITIQKAAVTYQIDSENLVAEGFQLSVCRSNPCDTYEAVSMEELLSGHKTVAPSSFSDLRINYRFDDKRSRVGRTSIELVLVQNGKRRQISLIIDTRKYVSEYNCLIGKGFEKRPA